MNGLTNYTHTERFGNIGDLFKHSCLIEVFESIAKRKPSPGIYLDSHSGYARYKLSEHSGRLPGEQEWSLGVLLGQEGWNSNGIRSLINYVRQHNTYPGSPALAIAFSPSDTELVFYDTCKDAADSIRDAKNDRPRAGQAHGAHPRSVRRKLASVIRSRGLSVFGLSLFRKIVHAIGKSI